MITNTSRFRFILFIEMVFVLVTSQTSGEESKSAPYPAPGKFKEIDEAVGLLPKSDLDGTAAALVRIGKDDWGKARALFDWLCDNISYDAESFYHPGPLNQRVKAAEPASVFVSGKAVCAGYSSLYCALAKKMGLEAVLISGRAKGLGYEPLSEITVNHDWDAVKIDGKWHLMDSTWGAGYLNNEAEGFKRRFDPMWFDIPPELAIHWHLPEKKEWALLDHVPTYGQYKQEIPPNQAVYTELALADVPLRVVVNTPIGRLPSPWQTGTLRRIGFPSESILKLAENGLSDQEVNRFVALTEAGSEIPHLLNIPRNRLPSTWQTTTLHRAGFPPDSILKLATNGLSDEEVFKLVALAEAGADVSTIMSIPQEQLPSAWQTTSLNSLGYAASNIIALAKRGLADNEVSGRQLLAKSGLTVSQILGQPDHPWTSDEAYKINGLIAAGFPGDKLLSNVSKALPTLYATNGWQFRVLEAPASGELEAGVPAHFRIMAQDFKEGGAVMNGKLSAQHIVNGILDISIVPPAGSLTINLKGMNEGSDSYWAVLGYEVTSR